MSHLLGIVLEQGGHDVFVEGFVPLAAVVGKLDVLLLGLVFWAFKVRGAEGELCGAGVELAGAPEGFVEQRLPAGQLEMLVVEGGHLVEVELVLEEACLVLPYADAVFVFAFLVDDADAVDALVHADRVFPVVGALGILRVVLDAHGLVGTRMWRSMTSCFTPRTCARGAFSASRLSRMP